MQDGVTATGVGALIAEGKEVRTFDGRDDVMMSVAGASMTWQRDEHERIVVPRAQPVASNLPRASNAMARGLPIHQGPERD